MEKYKVIKVTIEHEYFIPMLTEERSEINGWTLSEIIEAWFNRGNINAWHATRDTHELGNGKKITKIEVLESGNIK